MLQKISKLAFSYIAIGCLMFALLACTTGASFMHLQNQSSCDYGTGQPTTCTITLTNGTSSTDSFNWSASSSPVGAQFNPSSGTLAPGSSSDSIQVVVPAGICPFALNFEDNETQASTTVQVNNC